MTEQRANGFLIFMVILVVILSSAITWKVLSLNSEERSNSDAFSNGNLQYLTGGQVAIEVHPREQAKGGA